jgi:hypothetical protein
MEAGLLCGHLMLRARTQILFFLFINFILF